MNNNRPAPDHNVDGAIIDFAPALKKALLETIRSDEFIAVFLEIQLGRPETPKFLNAKTLAECFGVSPAMICQLKKQGLPFLIVGQEARFDEAECLAWFRDRQAKKAGAK